MAICPLATRQPRELHAEWPQTTAIPCDGCYDKGSASCFGDMDESRNPDL